MRASIARALVTEPQLLLMDEPFAALDEITRFKLNNDLLALWQELRRTVIFVTHSVFESVYLSQRIVVMTPRPGRRVRRNRDPRALSARRALPHLGRLCRLLPAGRRGAGAGDGRRAMSDRALRIGLPVLVLALGVLVWDLVVRVFAIPPYVLPGPGLVLHTLIADGGLLWHSLLVTLLTTFEGFLLAAVGGIGLAILFSQSRLLEYSLYPYAVILQVTPIVAIAPLLLIYLPQPLAVLACAWIVAFFPVLANTTLGLRLGRPQSARAVRTLQSLALAVAVESEAAVGAAADARRLAHRRRAVADRRGGGRDRRRLRRRRLGARLPHRRVRLPAQHPAHVRGAAVAVARRRRDLLRAVGALASRCCAAGTRARSSASAKSKRYCAIAPSAAIDIDDLDQAAVQPERQHPGYHRQHGSAAIERERIEGIPAQRAGNAFRSLGRTARAARTRPTD